MKTLKPSYQLRQDLFNAMGVRKGLGEELCRIKK